ncbi:putative MoxY [Aspergillus pseudoustus]|uniref:MoxY n=1 Tax=Aspergillus pseudoustus TaxID=1810923 RepID=A0ABR4J2V6_9EURO
MGSIANSTLTDGQPNINGNAEYKIRESHMGTKRKLKVIFMGMGCSGINFAHQLRQKTEDIELVIYEKNNDIGGTWLENRYPGCACDIPSVCYQYSWQRKTDWEHYYSGSKQIHEYFCQVAKERDVLKYSHLNHQIVCAEWLHAPGKWKVTVMRNNDPSDIIVDYGDYFVNGGGVLNKWRWPDIKGLDVYKGTLLHTARWNEHVDLTGKKVLMIGVGSSGVQVAPTIIDKVDQLFVVARSAIWVTAGFAPTYAGPSGQNFAYSKELQQKFQDDPEYYLWYCKAIESELNIRFKFYINGSQDAEEARAFSIAEMRRKLAAKPELMEKLIPSNFGVGCRRPTPGNGFLEALCMDKTTVLTGEMQELTQTGFIDGQGNSHDVDVVICATGFDTSFQPGFPVIVDGHNVQDNYSNGDIVGYMGLSIPDVPNYFVFIGPYGPLGHGSVIPMVEAYTAYILQVLEKAQVEDIKSLKVNRSVAEAFTRHADLYLKRTAWSGPCSSWFKNGISSRKPLCWPGSRVHYLTMLQKPRFEDFDIEYLSSNRFNFLGDGFEMREFDGRDITWYYGLLNNEDKQPTAFPEARY